MITTALLILMALAILVLVVVVVYLLDRFNGLERETKGIIQGLEDQAQVRPAGPYAGLSGKALWDAVAGEPPPGIDELALDGIRKRYRLLLAEHIGQVFNEGVNDQRRGAESVPSNSRTIRTPRTQVDSWLPPEAVAEIYRCGQGFGRGDPSELPELRQRLDGICLQLHEQAGLETLQSASSVLMPVPEAAPFQPVSPNS